MCVVFLLGAVPLLLMNTIINTRVREITLKNTKTSTQGILDQSQKYLNEILGEIDNFSNELKSNSKLKQLLDNEHLSENNISVLRELKYPILKIDNIVLIDVQQDHSSFIYNQKSQSIKKIDKKVFKDFLQSQQALLLIENSKRSLWLGTEPANLTGVEKSIWNYKILNTNKSTYILGVSVNSDLLKDLIITIETSTESEVKLITYDNNIFPDDKTFFNNSFAPLTLSRTTKGRFINIHSNRINNSRNEKLLIQVYSDPQYFYNLIVLIPENNLLMGFKTISRTTNITLIILTLFSLSFGLFIIYLLDKRIEELINGVKSISLGNFKLSLPKRKFSIKEDVVLTHAIIEVAKEISDNRTKLKNINKNLEKRVLKRTKELNETRESLVHSEKMAILGRNAAKTAHEINNPLGITITAASHLSTLLEDLEININSDALKKSSLSDYLQSSKEIIVIIQQNLKRAAVLTSGFKNIASDLSSRNKVLINICPYINEIIRSYSFNQENKNIKINFNCDSELYLITDPTIIYQIITNLINNSILHAFSNIDKGVIDITVTNSDEIVELIFKDNGNGISRDIMSQIYKPFFTTKHGEGGSGLGLNIIKELIEKNLNGSIDCKSMPGVGTEFLIRVPKGDNQ